MKTKIIAVFVALSLLIATTLTGKTHTNCSHTCVHTHVLVRMMTEVSVCSAVSCKPINHNWQEYALLSNKTYEIEDPTYYMEGLTAISKRCIYVGEATDSCRLAVKFII